jgi:hypothetical protein
MAARLYSKPDCDSAASPGMRSFSGMRSGTEIFTKDYQVVVKTI